MVFLLVHFILVWLQLLLLVLLLQNLLGTRALRLGWPSFSWRNIDISPHRLGPHDQVFLVVQSTCCRRGSLRVSFVDLETLALTRDSRLHTRYVCFCASSPIVNFLQTDVPVRPQFSHVNALTAKFCILSRADALS